MADLLRYVVLRHEQIADPHFDLMFEREASEGPALRTWRSRVWPITGVTRLEPLADHRVEYLEYEGPVRGNRGIVRRVASGTCHLEAGSDRQHVTIHFRDGPLHPSLVIELDGRCRTVGP